MSSFTENFYGVLFNPVETFDKLKENPVLIQSAVIVFIIGILSTALKISLDSGNGLSLSLNIAGSAFCGLFSWLFFASFLELLAGIFKKGGKMKIFLCLSAFALLPQLFSAPLILLKTGGMLFKASGILLGFGMWIWTTFLTALAIMKTYEISPARLIAFVFVPAFGGIISFAWFVGFITTLIKTVQ